MNKVISFVTALFVLITPIFCVYADDISSSQAAEYALSLDKAIEMALTDNSELIANEHKAIAAKVNIKSAQLSRSPYKKMTVNVSSNFEAYCLKEGYYIEAAQMQERLAIREGEKIKNTISYNVTEAYCNMVLMDKLINAAQNSYNLALSNMNTVKYQYELGLISALDYENALISADYAKNSLESCRLNASVAEDNFRILLGIDDNAKIILTDEIECGDFETDFDTDVNKALDSRYDLFALKEAMELSESYWDLSTVLTESSATYNSAYADYLSAKNTYENAKKMIALKIKSAYNNIITSKSNLDIAKRQYEMNLKRYEAAKIKYDLGIISNIELTQAINELYDAQVSYAQGKQSYKMAVEAYKAEITVGL